MLSAIISSDISFYIFHSLLSFCNSPCLFVVIIDIVLQVYEALFTFIQFSSSLFFRLNNFYCSVFKFIISCLLKSAIEPFKLILHFICCTFQRHNFRVIIIFNHF